MIIRSVFLQTILSFAGRAADGCAVQPNWSPRPRVEKVLRRLVGAGTSLGLFHQLSGYSASPREPEFLR